MAKYTIHDVAHIIPVEQTATVIEAVENYLNEGVIPPFDPCLSCEPSHTRKLISLIQTAERTGLWPPARVKAKSKAQAKGKSATESEPEEREILMGGNDDPDVDFTEVFKDK